MEKEEERREQGKRREVGQRMNGRREGKIEGGREEEETGEGTEGVREKRWNEEGERTEGRHMTELRTWIQKTCIQLPFPLLTCSVTLGKSYHLSEFVSPSVKTKGLE